MTFIEGAGIKPAVSPVRPVYLMAKPPPDIAQQIAQQRRVLGMDARYPAERFHITLLPLGAHDALSNGDLARIDHAVAESRAEPAAILLDRLRGNRLEGIGMRDVKALQKRLASHLRAAGTRLPEYRFNPHLTLAYGVPPRLPARIAPIGWHVDEVLLIVSHYGQGRHEILCRWPLITRQWMLPFAA